MTDQTTTADIREYVADALDRFRRALPAAADLYTVSVSEQLPDGEGARCLRAGCSATRHAPAWLLTVVATDGQEDHLVHSREDADLYLNQIERAMRRSYAV